LGSWLSKMPILVSNKQQNASCHNLDGARRLALGGPQSVVAFPRSCDCKNSRSL
jgi:hypothetical protein